VARWTETPAPKLTGPRNVVDSVLRAIAVISIAVVLFACSNQPKPESRLASSPGTSPAAAVPLAHRACRGVDLALSVGPSGAYHGYATQELSLVNRASDACSLAGVPAMLLYLDAGGQIAVASGPFRNVGIDLTPGQTVITLIGTPGSCAGAGTHPEVGSELNLNMPSGDVMSADGAWVNVECGGPTVILFEAV
jgi:Protein of unknown function (DUF4232)